MNDKTIKQLALASYVNGKLNETRVNRISRNLSRAELKKYVKALIRLNQQQKVYVSVAKSIKQIDKNLFEQLFPGKEIIVTEDKSLIAGIRIVDNDMIYEQSVKNNLDNLLSYINH